VGGPAETDDRGAAEETRRALGKEAVKAAERKRRQS
jgi:hypothetical protein